MSRERMPTATVRRILIVGSTSAGAIEHYFYSAFNRLGVHATIFDVEGAAPYLNANRVVNRLTYSVQHIAVGRALQAFLRDHKVFDAVIVVKGFFLSATAIRAGREATGIPWINFNPDSPFDPGRGTSNSHVRSSISEYDAYFIWSRRLLPLLIAAGARRAEYLPFAHDSDTHFSVPARDIDQDLTGVVSFVGSFDRQRAQLLETVADLPLRIYGNAWDMLPRRSKLRNRVVSTALFGHELRRVISSSLANINILRPQNAGSHNMRTFEVPAHGALMVTTQSIEQEDFFPAGVASLAYSDPLDLRSKLEALIAGRYDVASIRAQALIHSAGQSYLARAQRMLDVIAIL